MVNKQVEKRLADLCSEFLLINEALREEIVIEIQEQLRVLAAREANERSLHYTKLDHEPRMTLRWLREMEEYRKNAEEDQVDANSLGLDTIRFLFSERTDGNSNDEDISHGDSTYDANVADSSSRPAKREQEGNKRALSDLATGDESSRTLFHNFKTETRRCKKIYVRGTLMEEQWKEWMEMRGNHYKVQPVDEQQTENQREAARPPQKQNIKGVGTARKVRAYFRELFHPRASFKWKRLEDETDHFSFEEE